MRILVIGASSFVAKGVVESMIAAGHEVLRFQRGSPGLDGDTLRGSLESLSDCAELVGSIDAVVNYAILKDQEIAANVAAIDGILGFCQTAGVERLVHFSSISVYDAGAESADEGYALPDDPLSKGAYGSLKVATDLRLIQQDICKDLKIAFIRPGFVLGSGLIESVSRHGLPLAD